MAGPRPPKPDTPRILLGGYAAKQCPVRVHNDFAPLVPTPDRDPSPEHQADLDAGVAFEAEVSAELLRLHPHAAVIDPELPKSLAIDQTLEAIGAGQSLILGGWLPDDEEGGRKGKPDILIAVAGGYLPADVKNHGTVKSTKRTSTNISPLDRPDAWNAVEKLGATSHYYDDGIQLAHYTRMLQTLGVHPGDHLLHGAIVGTSVLDLSGAGAGLVFAWHDLAAPVRETFSRTRGKVRRSLLECYDFEHSSRIRVAVNATRIVGAEDDPAPLVVPIGQKECRKCPYEIWCAEQMGPQDASVAIGVNGLGVREWRTLRSRGLGTVDALADLDPAEPGFLTSYVDEVGNLGTDHALKRLTATVHQARMIRDGVGFEPAGDDEVAVPAADIEIDLDLEWDKEDRIYQWGLRIREGQDESTACYEPVVSFDDLDDDAELALAEQASARIVELRVKAAREGKTLAVYHWHHVEVSKTRRFECAVAALDGVSVDLLDWFTGSFRVQGSAGIKNVASLFGFSWSVDDPGGRTSQDKIEAARAGGEEAEAARQWCLRYNDSDVAAQAAIRDGVRRWLAQR